MGWMGTFCSRILHRLSSDKQGCLIGCHKPIVYKPLYLQIRFIIRFTRTIGVPTKGLLCGVQYLILYRDDVCKVVWNYAHFLPLLTREALVCVITHESLYYLKGKSSQLQWLTCRAGT